MTLHTPRRRRRTALPGLALAAALTAGCVPALADNPVFEYPARFTSNDSRGGSLVPDAAPFYAAVRGYPGAGGLAGHWATQNYCTPYGAGTAIVGYRVLLGRWHATLGDSAYVDVNGSTGNLEHHVDGELPKGNAYVYGQYAGAARAITPQECVGVQVVLRNRVAAGTTLTWTTDLQRVAIEDQIGPSVGAPRVLVNNWVTGDAVPVEFEQSDNAFNRGGVSGVTVGGGAVDAGDVGNGDTIMWVPVGGLADGRHQVKVSRSAPGWTTATRDAWFTLDRMPPNVPTLDVTTEQWTNASEVQVYAAATQDAASGWDHNEYRVDGGGWSAGQEHWAFVLPGVHTVQARAVDHAGHASGPSQLKTVRIDRTPPAITGLEVDPEAEGGVAVRFRLADDASGLGDCKVTLAMNPGSGWVTMVDLPGSIMQDGGRLLLSTQGWKAGQRDVRVTACDAVGNTTSRTTRFMWTPRVAPTATPVPASSTLGPVTAADRNAVQVLVVGPSPTRPRITIRRSFVSGVAFVSVGSRPARAGMRVRLQRLVGSTWRTAAWARTGASGHARMAVPAGPGRYRVQIPRQAAWPYAPLNAAVRLTAR